MTKVAEFAIEYSQFLDPSGRATGPLPDFAKDGRRWFRCIARWC